MMQFGGKIVENWTFWLGLLWAKKVKMM